ncbi:hypothetical protein PENSPDRAFT_695772 [Peniophora sp. CONT]|nr:hypothetical protein PENSPDRAFT_695772 [Peniophora sp. CONT]
MSTHRASVNGHRLSSMVKFVGFDIEGTASLPRPYKRLAGLRRSSSILRPQPMDMALAVRAMPSYLVPFFSRDVPSPEWFRPKAVNDYNLAVLAKVTDHLSNLMRSSADSSWADKVHESWKTDPMRRVILKYLREEMHREQALSLEEETRAVRSGRGSLHVHWVAAQGLVEMGHYAAQGIPVLRHVIRHGSLVLTGNRSAIPVVEAMSPSV